MLFPQKSSLTRERRAELSAFQKEAQARFRDIDLLNLAFTHRSCTNEDKSPNNEKLEFLGDSVLGMVVANRLFELLADKAEGDLARVKSYVVSEESLAGISLAFGVDRLLLLGKGEEHSGGRTKKAILADALEAIIGAHYLDSGFEAATKFVLRLVEPEIEKVLQNRHRKDYKTLLQEYLQKFHRSYPAYRLAKKTGPDHDRTFWISCAIGDTEYGPASGKNKKEAEQAAACMAYESIMAGGGVEAARLRQIENQ
ncbi:MAG TPA: ribonuclease III [Rectinemataceae bacterium]|nr:ribonuclease III [Rectinemataceae bacterium]